MVTRISVLAAAVCGVLSSLAFDPVGLPGAMVLGVAGFLVVLDRLAEARTRTVAFTGVAYGLGFMGPLVWWMNALGAGAYIAMVASQLAYFALLAVGLRRVRRLRWWPLWGAAVWVGIEYLRNSFPYSGFPWGRLAHTAIDTPFESYVRLLGMPGLSALMFMAATAIASLALKRTAKHAILVAALLLGILGLGTLLPTGIAGAQEDRQIALVQGNTPSDFGTWPIGEIFLLHAAETRRLIAEIGTGAAPAPDFVLWPENSSDRDPSRSADEDRVLRELSRELDAPILVGGIFDGPSEKTAYNAGVVWDENGPGDQRYIKRMPVPYGEYVPFRKFLSPLVPRFEQEIPRDMLAGHKPGAIDIADVTIGDTICYDIAYDGNIRDNINGGAQLLVVQTSNASFTGTSQIEQQWKISRLRAIETGRYVLVPSTNGISGIVDPEGHAVARAETQVPATLSAQVTLADGKTAAIRFGGMLEALLLILALVSFLRGRVPSTGRRE